MEYSTTPYVGWLGKSVQIVQKKICTVLHVDVVKAVIRLNCFFSNFFIKHCVTLV